MLRIIKETLAFANDREVRICWDCYADRHCAYTDVLGCHDVRIGFLRTLHLTRNQTIQHLDGVLGR